MRFRWVVLLVLAGVVSAARAEVSVVPGPDVVPCFGLYEVTVRFDPPPRGNPFTDVEVRAVFRTEGQPPVPVDGFCDDQAGQVFRVRFCPTQAGAEYSFAVTTNLSGDRAFTGSFRTTEPTGMPPVVVDPRCPKHFVLAGSERPFFHMGLTAYHLLDPTNDDRQVEQLLDYCTAHGFNKVRFLLTGYPRDTDRRPRGSRVPSSGNPWKQINYGALPGEVNPLPAWLGKPHRYDFTRFNVSYWQKVDRAVAAMRRRGIVATCIFTIEKQKLPKEYGALTDDEKRLYRYAVARLAAFSNVWWDLGNEHNEYRTPEWARRMGRLVKQWDPYDRLCSAHAYADWVYDNDEWADFIITQQYGDCETVNGWVLKYRDVPKPYVNEEYGYEGSLDKPGHGQNTDWVRKCHWSIALAGGYATYGDWTTGAPFYTGHVGKGRAPAQLRWLRQTFESLPFVDMVPRNDLVGTGAFCLALPKRVYLAYLPDGGVTQLRATKLSDGRRYRVTWIDPRTGQRRQVAPQPGPVLTLRAPRAGDWAVLVEAER